MPLLVNHRIDCSSPLRRWYLDRVQNPQKNSNKFVKEDYEFEIVVIYNGIDELTSMNVQHKYSFKDHEIKVGFAFENMV
eukprot:CAMPEP_0116897156 /NCGR_PEP_ID=MMETSP0467-20121206/6229_1 /TAXON_ID=283647 /ORGANISM="Mesodinium pulex, Strain SPMC105" /LENGTH=78 /DNA_ID=CAMNT_0004568703 /DNA_START=573 /DNA_END=809 /DNA_ORIENTATION=+